MGAIEKIFLKKSLILTIITIILMSIVAIVMPKEKFVMILIIEVTLALIWTIICAINVYKFVLGMRKRDEEERND